MSDVRFDSALDNLIGSLAEKVPELLADGIIIRDLYGKLRIVVNADAPEVERLDKLSAPVWIELGAYGRFDGRHILGTDDFFDPDLMLHDPDIVEYVPAGTNWSARILDRQVTGQDWARAAAKGSHPTRVAFYGLKGGVGRSTALVMEAYHLGTLGKNVLLIDFDLESPGLSGILLPFSELPEVGIVDWFVEDAVGQSAPIVERMAALSPISQMPGMRGSVRIVPAFGIDEHDYLAKLSRSFVDVPRAAGGVEGFGARARRMIEALETAYKPDVVLIDARAGLHDLAAVSIVGLADSVLMFAVDTDQTWQGYKLLFSHWMERPSVLFSVRNKIVMIHAMFPEEDQSRRTRSFIEHSHELFTSTIYETEDETGAEVFNYDLMDTDAPHYPHRVFWNKRFLEFSSTLFADGTLGDDFISATFGELFQCIDERLPGGRQ
jgi:hypothetical protein